MNQNLVELESKLATARQELSERETALGTAVLAGKDPGKLGAEVLNLRAKADALLAAVEAAKAAEARELAATQAATQAAEEEAKRKDKDDLRAKEERLYTAIVGKLVDLNRDLGEIAEIQGQLWAKHNSSPYHGIPADLAKVTEGTLKYLGAFDPEALGLPPRLTDEERAKIEAKYNLARMQARVDALVTSKRENYSPGVEAVIEAARADLERAKQRT